LLAILGDCDNAEIYCQKAEEAGFSSHTTFYRHFREKYGLSPEEFRKSIK